MLDPESESSAEPKHDLDTPSRFPAKRWLVPMVLAAVLAASLVVATVATVDPNRSERERAEGDGDLGVATLGSKAPAFEIDTVEGGKFRLEDARGKLVVVNFWGTWCAPCEREMPYLQKAADSFGDDIAVVGLAVNDDESSVRSFTKRLDIRFPVGLDDGRIAGLYLVSGFPTTVIVDRTGVVVDRVSRAFPSYEDLVRHLQEAGLEREGHGSVGEE